MTKTTGYFAENPDFGVASSAIDDALRTLRVNGTLLLREAYVPPWSIAIPDADGLAALLDNDGVAQVVAFHLVEFGNCAIQPEGDEELLLKAGDMAICFAGNAHRLTQGEPSEIQPVEALLAGGDNPRHPDEVGQAAGTGLLCGVFFMHNTQLNPLFSALPRLMRTTLSRAGELHNLSAVARLMAEEIDRRPPGGGYIVERLLEVLCAEAVRAHIETAPHWEAGWFRGIKDPVIGRAIARMHGKPGASWSVQGLAAEVAMSPSRFAARFSESMGDSPMAYLAKWRMNVACRELAASRLRLDEVAKNAGYESLSAFSRAFKKHLGVSPARWRERARPC